MMEEKKHPFKSTQGKPISDKESKKRCKRFVDEYPDLTRSSFIGKDILLRMINQRKEVTGLRIMNGIKDDGSLSPCIVAVGIDGHELKSSEGKDGDGPTLIVNDTLDCPTICPGGSGG